MKNRDAIKSMIRLGWQMLGELILPVDVSVSTAIHVWVMDVIGPLHLRADFLNKISTSAQEAAARALQLDNVSKSGHLHLIAFAPAIVTSKAGTWGFFRIEKFGSGASSTSADHTIELYLYVEGP